MQKLSNIFFIVVVVLAAIGLRYYFLSLPGFTFDLNQFLKWGIAVKDNGFWSVYSAQNVSMVDNYPPLIPLVSSWWFSLTQFVHADPKLLFKILQTFFEVILTATTAIYVLRSSIKYKGALFALVVISPAFALVTSAWGQADVIFTLFLLLGFLVGEKHPTIGTLLMFLSLMTKPQAALGILIYFLYLLFSKGTKNFFVQLVIFLGVFAGFEILFRTIGHISLINILFGALGFYKNITLNAFNFWWMLHGSSSWNIQDTISAGSMSYKSLGLVIFAIFEVPAIIYLIYKGKKLSEALLVLAYSYLIFFIFPTEMHERYLFPAVAFFAFAAILNKNIFWVYLILTATLFLNCFAVLQSVYPQFPLLQYNLLNGSWTQLVAIVNLLVCCYLAVYLLYESFKTN